MGTQAALDNPRCRHDDPQYGPYGRFDTTVVGGGPACVKAWKEGADNGGATAQGVTKDRIRSSSISRTTSSSQTDPVKPTDRGLEHHRHVPGRGLRLPAARAAVLRDVGP